MLLWHFLELCKASCKESQIGGIHVAGHHVKRNVPDLHTKKKVQTSCCGTTKHCNIFSCYQQQVLCHPSNSWEETLTAEFNLCWCQKHCTDSLIFTNKTQPCQALWTSPASYPTPLWLQALQTLIFRFRSALHFSVKPKGEFDLLIDKSLPLKLQGIPVYLSCCCTIIHCADISAEWLITPRPHQLFIKFSCSAK